MAESTKEKIIRTAFSFYTVPTFADVSLQQIAQKIGISKAAIFRHFQNKEALQNAMQDTIYSEAMGILAVIQDCAEQQKPITEALEKLICFLCEHREYLGYYLSLNPVKSEKSFIFSLRKHGFTLIDSIYDSQGNVKDTSTYFSSVLFLVTLFFFILHNDTKENAIFAHKVMDFITSGLGDDISTLTEERIAELSAICSKNMEALPAEDKIFIALADVVKEYDLKGVTMQRVATRLNMAPSSLYSYFLNKDELITKSILNEFNAMVRIWAENIAHGKVPAERVYMLLFTNCEYFQRHSSMLAVFRWLNFTDSLPKNINLDLTTEQKTIFDVAFTNHMPDFGDGSADNKILHTWLFMLQFFIYLQSETHNFDKNFTKDSMLDVFHFVERGLKINFWRGKDE